MVGKGPATEATGPELEPQTHVRAEAATRVSVSPALERREDSWWSLPAILASELQVE